MAPLQVPRAAGDSPSDPVRDQSTDRRRPLPAWSTSILLHATILILVVLVFRATPRGATEETTRRGGIALVQTTSQETVYLSEPETRSSTAGAAAAATVAAALPEITNISLDLPGALPTDADIADGMADQLLPGQDGFTTGSDSNQKLSGYEVETSVFGIEGKGSKFIYVFDRSSSMEGYEGIPLAAAKSQLIRSLNDLKNTSQFQIIFYNGEATPWNAYPGQPPSMMFGDDSTKAAAIKFVNGVVGRGNTKHLQALRKALNLAPDVIFFLTDAEWPQLSREELDQVKRLNHGTSIHSIEFGVGPRRTGTNFLTQLARENNGRYTYVDITNLSHR